MRGCRGDPIEANGVGEREGYTGGDEGEGITGGAEGAAPALGDRFRDTEEAVKLVMGLGGKVGDIKHIGDSHGVLTAVCIRHGHKAIAFALDGYSKSGHPPRDGGVQVHHFIADAIVVLVGTTIAYPPVSGDDGHVGEGRTGG